MLRRQEISLANISRSTPEVANQQPLRGPPQATLGGFGSSRPIAGNGTTTPPGGLPARPGGRLPGPKVQTNRPGNAGASPQPGGARGPGPDESAGASTSARPEDDYSNCTCEHCGRSFRSFPGLRLHQRRAHLAEFHRDLVEQRKSIKKASWDPEELLLMATMEVQLAKGGERPINQALTGKVPGRTVEAIKGQRRSKRYQDLLASLRPGTGDQPLHPSDLPAGAGPRPAALPHQPRDEADPTGSGRPQPIPTSAVTRHTLRGSRQPKVPRQTPQWSSRLMRHTRVQPRSLRRTHLPGARHLDRRATSGVTGF